MILILPDYYQEFACLAAACQDSCCVGWEIDIDDETFDYYKSIEGPFGKRLRDHMRTDGCNSFLLQERRCPFLNKENLCDICIELGEESLCEICTEYPRFTMEYGSFREKCLGLSCEEAGRLIFAKEAPTGFVEMELAEEAESDEDWEAMEDWEDAAQEVTAEELSEEEMQALKQARDHCIHILQNRTYPLKERIARYLAFADWVQEQMNLGQLREMGKKPDTEFSDTQLPDLEGSSQKITVGKLLSDKKRILEGMELLDTEWERAKKETEQYLIADNYIQRMQAFEQAYQDRNYEYEHLLVYFTFRYFMRAVYDQNFLEKAQFAVFSMLVIRDMDGARFWKKDKVFDKKDRIDVARIFSKEVEHSEENMEYLGESILYEELMQIPTLLKWLNLHVF